MSTFDTVAAFNSLLQRKGLVGAILVADYAADALTDICSTGGELDPTALTDYNSLGKLSGDGVSVGGDITKQEMRGWGDAYPSRIDVESVSGQMTVTALETKAAVLDAFYNVDQSSVTPTANGTITFDQAPVPELRDKRVLALVRDINKSDGLDVYLGVHFPRANLTANGEQTIANSEAGLNYPLTIEALLDDAEGTAQRLFWGGPGLAGLLADMGYSTT